MFTLWIFRRLKNKSRLGSRPRISPMCDCGNDTISVGTEPTIISGDTPHSNLQENFYRRNQDVHRAHPNVRSVSPVYLLYDSWNEPEESPAKGTVVFLKPASHMSKMGHFDKQHRGVTAMLKKLSSLRLEKKKKMVFEKHLNLQNADATH